MLQRELIDTAQIEDGERLELYAHGRDFMIVLGRNELMSTRMRFSEEQLADLTIDRLHSESPRILIGGYGMGFTLRAALARVPDNAQWWLRKYPKRSWNGRKGRWLSSPERRCLTPGSTSKSAMWPR